ncbi:MAG: hypothetical protein GU348_02675 [Thermogladius sp.]|jgi:hypothetical protein|nr:hypothetical protein [Thermogladius sp.]
MSVNAVDQFYNLIYSVIARVASYTPLILVFLALSVMGYIAGYIVKLAVTHLIDFYVKWRLRKYPLFTRLYEKGVSVGGFIGWLSFSTILIYSIYYGLIITGSQHPIIEGSEAILISIDKVLVGMLIVVVLSTILVIVYSVISWVTKGVESKFNIVFQLILYISLFFIVIPIIGLGVSVAGGGNIILDAYQTYLPPGLLLATMVIAGVFLSVLLAESFTSYSGVRSEVAPYLLLALKILVSLLFFSAGVYLVSPSYPALTNISDVVVKITISLTLAVVGVIFAIYMRNKLVTSKPSSMLPVELLDVYIMIPVIVAFIVVALNFVGIRAEIIMSATVGSILLVAGLSVTQWVYTWLIKEGLGVETAVSFAGISLVLFTTLSAVAFLATYPEAVKSVGYSALAVSMIAIVFLVVYYLKRR